MPSLTLATCRPIQAGGPPPLGDPNLWLLVALLLALLAAMTIAIPQAMESWAARRQQRSFRQALGLRRRRTR